MIGPEISPWRVIGLMRCWGWRSVQLRRWC